MKTCRWISLIICFIAYSYSVQVSGQVSTHIANFNHKNYNGGVQNWGSDISPERILYVGNNNGLLRYNGNDWSILEPDERATIRAVHCKGERIYTAGDNNIGYWEQISNGEMIYTSLLPLVNQLGISGDTFWSIASQGTHIYFQSFSNVIYYDGQGVEYLVQQDCYSPLLQIEEKLFTQKFEGPLCQIIAGRLEVFCDKPIFERAEAKFMFELCSDRYLIGLSNGEVYTLESGELSLFVRLKNENNISVRIDCGDIWGDETVAVGTIGDGLFLINIADKAHTQILSPQLQDLNVHSVSFADENYLWLSLDSGISSIVLDPQMYLWRSNKEIGTFFDAAHFNGKTYIASNQGMYLYEDGGDKIQTSIFPLRFCDLKNELLCGTTTELYKMTTKEPYFQKIRDINGVSQFEYLADHGDEYLFLQSYSGISVLKYSDTWRYFTTLLGTESYMVMMPENIYTIWAVHSEKGLFRLRINEQMNKVEDFDNYSEIDGYSNYGNIEIVKVEDKIVFATPKGIYLFDIEEKNFKRQEVLSDQILHLDKLQSIKRAYRNNIWVAANDELFLYRITDLSAELLIHLPFVHNEFTLYDKHLNLRSVSDSITFVSTFEGTVVINSNKIIRNSSQSHPLYIEAVHYADKSNTTSYADPHQPEIELPNTATNIAIIATTGLQRYPTSISYRLVGISDIWSSWQTSGTIQFANLPSGEYRLEIRDYNQNWLTIPIVVIPPLYKRTWMVFCYILALVMVTIWLATYINRRKRKILLEQYEDEQRRHAEELQKQAYEQLQEKVRNQDSELKNRMRFLSQKQELLNSIMAEIESQKQDLGDRYPNKLYQRLMKIIQKGATERDKFLSFENYFVEVHHDFMLNMQRTYPTLSASELKFSCLIRANLSTKEIAVIMGIAVRSVELKRYRLKQRLNLDANDSLSSHILSIT